MRKNHEIITLVRHSTEHDVNYVVYDKNTMENVERNPGGFVKKQVVGKAAYDEVTEHLLNAVTELKLLRAIIYCYEAGHTSTAVEMNERAKKFRKEKNIEPDTYDDICSPLIEAKLAAQGKVRA